MHSLDPKHRRQVTRYALAAMMRYKWLRDRISEVQKSWIQGEDLQFIFDCIQTYAIEFLATKSSFKAWLLARYPERDVANPVLQALAMADYPLDESESLHSFNHLLEYGRLDQVKLLANEIERKAEKKGLDEALEWFGGEVNGLPMHGDKVGIYISELLKEDSAFMKDYAHKTEYFLATGKQLDTGVPIGWPRLSHAMGGLQEGRLVVIGARPGCCKSATMLQWAANMSRSGYKSIYISLEMSAEELCFRLLSESSSLPLSDLTDRRLSKTDFVNLVYAASHNKIPSADNIIVVDHERQTVATIGRIIRNYAQDNVKVVFIDYLQIMEADFLDRSQPRHVQVAAISRGLKHLARELGVCIVVGAQLSREVEARGDPKPRLRDLRESGSIEQDADQVILLDRPELRDPMTQPGILKVYLRKNRHGAPLEVDVHANLAMQQLRELEVVGEQMRKVKSGYNEFR